MKFVVAKLYRVVFKGINTLLNLCKILLIKIKYPKVSISFDSKIGRGCDIRCSDKSRINISNSIIGANTLIQADHGGEVIIENSFIGRNNVIVAREKIEIKSDCQIAEMVVIRDQNHNFGKKDKTIVEQGFNCSPITIENNVWLSAKVTVTAGSRIGKNTVVGANAVVKGTLDSNSVYVGVPVKKIRSFNV